MLGRSRHRDFNPPQCFESTPLAQEPLSSARRPERVPPVGEAQVCLRDLQEFAPESLTDPETQRAVHVGHLERFDTLREAVAWARENSSPLEPAVVVGSTALLTQRVAESVNKQEPPHRRWLLLQRGIDSIVDAGGLFWVEPEGLRREAAEEHVRQRVQELRRQAASTASLPPLLPCPPDASKPWRYAPSIRLSEEDYNKMRQLQQNRSDPDVE